MSKERLLPLFILLGCQVETPSAKTPDASPVPSPLAGTAVHAGRAPGKIEPGVSSDCTNYSVIAQGPYQYQSNMWASDKAKGPFEQCVLSRQLDGKTQLGWTWAWPGFERLGFGYPELIRRLPSHPRTARAFVGGLPSRLLNAEGVDWRLPRLRSTGQTFAETLFLGLEQCSRGCLRARTPPRNA
jgi:hypothetical protein